MSNPEKFEIKIEKEKAPEERWELKEICLDEYERFGSRAEEIIEVPKDYLESVGEEKAQNKARQDYIRNGSIDIKDIKYITNDGKIFSLQELLLPGWKLARTFIKQHAFSDRFKKIFYEHSLIHSKGFFLALLHEIGHVYFLKSLSGEEEKSDYLNKRRELEALRNRCEVSQVELSSEEKELYKKYVIYPEKKAWAWALKNFRRLRRDGIDLEPQLKSIKEILCYVMTSLSSYEKDLSLEEQEDIFKVIFGGEIEKGERFLKKELRK